MTDYYVGEIRMMAAPKNGNNIPPMDWVICDGAMLQIRNYQALFSLIGTTYGGDGVNTFGVPNLLGRLPMGEGQGPGLTSRTIGQSLGNETVALVTSNTPPHVHALKTAGANAVTPSSAPDTGKVIFANTAAPTAQYLRDAASGTAVTAAAPTVGTTGNGAPHDNVMPSTPLTFMICVNGLYPTRP
jgi:microcystin-dependent protein